MNYFSEKDKKLELIYNFELNYCNICDNKLYENDIYNICNECGFTKTILKFDDKNVFSENHKQIYPYKQINHYKYKLLKIQCNDNENIPDYVINELKKHKYDTIFELHYIMKKLKFSKYYKNIILIDYKIKGKLRYDFDNQLFYKIFNDFEILQNAFYNDKINNQMINYNFLIFKQLMLYKRYDIATNVFFIHKYPKTIKKYDAIWLNICNKLNWEFSSTNNDFSILKDFLSTKN